MLEIKFRGKRLDNKEWVYGGYYSQDNYRKGDRRHIIVWEHQGAGMSIIHEPVDPKTIGQYTGTKDKNGTEIYTGDIVYYKNDQEHFPGLLVYEKIGVVKIDKGMTGTSGRIRQVYRDRTSVRDDNSLLLSPEIYEVIGNIHDNPELLEA